MLVLSGYFLTGCLRSQVLQPGAMTAQLDYYRSVLSGGSDAAKALVKANRLGPRKNGGQARKLELPVLMVRGKQDIALLGSLCTRARNPPLLVMSRPFSDRLLMIAVDGVEDYLADSRLVEFDACSHWVQHDASPALNKELSAFLAELEAAK